MNKLKISEMNVVEKDIEELKGFQGNLKELHEKQFKMLKKSIEKYGFRIPIFTWENNILDGHSRIYVLNKLGYRGKVPVIELEAKDEKEAKKLILLINSNYGKITDEGLYEYLETNKLDFDELKLEMDLPDIDLKYFEQGYYKGIENEEDWEGMPEFENEDIDSKYKIIVHMKSEKDLNEFSKLVNQTITDKTKYIWFPKEGEQKVVGLVDYKEDTKNES